MNNIEKITDRIKAEAQAYRDEEVSQAKKNIAELTDSYKSKMAYYAAKKKSATEKEIDAISKRAESSSELVKRNMILDAKTKLIDESYSKALAFLLALPEQEYYTLLTDMLSGAIETIGKDEVTRKEHQSESEYEKIDMLDLILNENDREKFGKQLVDSGKIPAKNIGKTLALSYENASLPGGFILRCGEVETNCDLSLLVGEIREGTEGEVYSALFDA